MTTLARLSFWVRPQRLDDFEHLCAKTLLPHLEKHSLERANINAPPGAKGVFSLFFEVESLGAVIATERTLRSDPAWIERMGQLGTTFGPTNTGNALPYRFSLYKTPAGPGKSRQAGPGLRQGLWLGLRRRDGLAGGAIFAILQDRQRQLWFGGDGLSRYDGETFTHFASEDGLSSDNILSIAEDRQGTLWFGTGDVHRGNGSGVSRYDGQTFTSFAAEDGLADNAVQAIKADRQGHLWFGTWKGLSRYDGTGFTSFYVEDGLAGNHVRAIAESRSGNLWFATGGGVSCFDGKTFTSFTEQDGLANNDVRGLAEDHQGYMWFATNGGVSCYDGKTFTSFNEGNGLIGNSVHCVVEDEKHHMWFGTSSGIVDFREGKIYQSFTERDGLANVDVGSAQKDSEGHLWFGTYGGGACRYEGERFAILTSQDDLVQNQLKAVLEDKAGHLWCATLGGISRYDGNGFNTLEELLGKAVSSLLEDRRGHIWFGTGGHGVWRYDGNKTRAFTSADGLAHNSVFSMLEDHHGHLWFGTYGGGISRYDGHSFTTFTSADGLTNNEIFSLLEDRCGNLWVGTQQGLNRYYGSGFVEVEGADCLAGQQITAMFEDRQGQLWFGTWEGIFLFDGHQFFRFAEPLPEDRIKGFAEDEKGHLWISLFGGGVGRYDGQVMQNLSKQDGLVDDAVHQVLHDRQDRVWIATEGGLVRYRPCLTPPTIRFTGLSADRRYAAEQEVQLTDAQHLVTFEFQGQSLTTPAAAMAYVYRLEGRDSDWQTTRAQRVEYQDLLLGTYSFQVRAVDQDLNYSPPATIQVNIAPDLRLEALASALSESGGGGEFIGHSAAIHAVQTELAQVAPTDVAILIQGETGTGKGVAARTVHGLSQRAAGPLIQVNCGALPASLVESELFGHEKGAFTGASARKLGKAELASGGTLFLDEIGDMPLEAQVKLLHLLEEHRYERVGGTQTLTADVRIVAATNRDLQRMVAADTFRQDLYFRLQVFPVTLPPLRQRREDIPLLATYFIEKMAAHLDKETVRLSPKALQALKAYAWPGNVRELEHMMQRAVIVCQTSTIQVEELAHELRREHGNPIDERPTPEEYEQLYLREVLDKTGWVVKGSGGAAALLGMNEATLRSRMKKIGLVRPQG